MRRWISIPRSRSDGLALEAHAARAALACAYSTSDEYEAAVISARRAAGAYDSGRRHRHVLYGIAVGIGALIILAAAF
jgi:hypothetical protein